MFDGKMGRSGCRAVACIRSEIKLWGVRVEKYARFC